MKSSTITYKQSLQNKGGVKLYTNGYYFVVVAPNLQVVVIIKKGENVNHEDFHDVKKIKPWIMRRHHQKGGECGSCIVLMMSKRNNSISSES